MLPKLVRVSWKYVAWNKIIISITCIQHHYGIIIVIWNQFHVSLGFFPYLTKTFMKKPHHLFQHLFSLLLYSASFLEQGSPDSVKTARAAQLQHSTPPGPLCWPRLQQGLNYSSHTVIYFACKEQNLCEVILRSTQGLDEQQALKLCVHSLVLFCMLVKVSNVAHLKEASCIERIVVCSWLLSDSSSSWERLPQKEAMIIAM